MTIVSLWREALSDLDQVFLISEQETLTALTDSLKAVLPAKTLTFVT